MPARANKPRVLILDDHGLFRESLARLLQAEHDFDVRHCGSVQEGVSMISEWPADVVLLDFDLGNEKGSSFPPQAHAAGFCGKILLLTAGVNEWEAADLIRQGISGIVLKHSSPTELSEGIRESLSGKVWLDQGYLKKVMEKVSAQPEAANARTFTERERQVLSFVLEGLANKEIADRLRVSESSVKASLQQLFEKTGVRTRSQLVRVALEQYKDLL
jgi:two-component system, NarL family, nitrate/nitrite response regulator NarL